jgi:hypothetical protein
MTLRHETRNENESLKMIDRLKLLKRPVKPPGGE